MSTPLYTKITFYTKNITDISNIKLNGVSVPLPFVKKNEKDHFSIIINYAPEIKIELDEYSITLYLVYYKDEYEFILHECQREYWD
jgi:hypothetical protein